MLAIGTLPYEFCFIDYHPLSPNEGAVINWILGEKESGELSPEESAMLIRVLEGAGLTPAEMTELWLEPDNSFTIEFPEKTMHFGVVWDDEPRITFCE